MHPGFAAEVERRETLKLLVIILCVFVGGIVLGAAWSTQKDSVNTSETPCQTAKEAYRRGYIEGQRMEREMHGETIKNFVKNYKAVEIK